jgi:hypothetical protein
VATEDPDLSQVTLLPAQGRALLFVVPAHERVELARICYRQFRELRETLRERDCQADVLIVSDDDNLDAAESELLHTLEHANPLGARLNAGFSWAAEHGYDYVCPIGNDSFMHPDRFGWLPGPETILCTRNYTCLNADATEQAWLWLEYPGGVGSRVIPLSLLERYDYKPLPDNQASGCDTGTLMALCRNTERAPNLVYTDLHPAEVVGFQSGDSQVTKWNFWLQHLKERQEPFTGLADLYGAELVDQIRDHYTAAIAA